jgi:hypothetical protein
MNDIKIGQTTIKLACQKQLTGGDAPVNVKRYYKFLSEQPDFSSVMKKTPQVQVKAGKDNRGVATSQLFLPGTITYEYTLI